MKKRTKSALLLGGCALVLILTLVGVRIAKNIAAGKETTEEGTLLLSLPTEGMEKITLTYEGETLTFVPDDDRVWWTEEYPGLAIDQAYPESMVGAVESLTALRELGAVENRAEYGLDPVVCSVTYTCEGKEYPVSIGHANGVHNNYYLSLGTEDEVYLVDSAIGNACQHSFFVMAEKDEIPTFSRNLRIQMPGTDIRWIEGGSKKVYTPEYEWFLTDETHTDLVVGAEQVTELVGNISGITWNGIVDYRPDDAALVKYGLGSASFPVQIDYIYAETDDEGETTESEEVFTIEFGRAFTDENGQELVYATTGDSGLVYTLDAEVANAFRNMTPESMMPLDVLRMDWTTVDSIQVTAGDLTHEIDISYTLRENEEGEMAEVYSFAEDGVELDAALTEAFIDYLSFMEAERTMEGITELAPPDITVVFHRNTGDEFDEMTFSIHPYDQSFSVVSFNGYQRILVNKNHVAELLLHFENIR